MRNKEVLQAAREIRHGYSDRFPMTIEWGWQMMYVRTTRGVITGLKNCTGVLLVQRDLWYEGAEKVEAEKNANSTRFAETARRIWSAGSARI